MNIVNCGITNFIKNHPDIEINLLEEMLSFLKSLKNLDADDIFADYWSVDDSLVVRLWNGNKSVSIMKNLTIEEDDDDGITDPIYQIIGWHEKTIKTGGDSDDIEYIVKIVTNFLKDEN